MLCYSVGGVLLINGTPVTLEGSISSTKKKIINSVRPASLLLAVDRNMISKGE